MKPLIATALVIAGVAGLTGCKSGTPAHAEYPAAVSINAGSASTVRDATGMLATRPVWPVGVPLYVSINPGPVVDTKPHVIRITGEWPGAPVMESHAIPSTIRCVMPRPGITWDDHASLAGTAPTGSEVRFRLSVTDPEGRDPKSPRVTRRSLTLPVKLAGTVADVMTGVALPDVDAALATQLNATFHRHGWHSNDVPRLWVGTYTNCEGAPNTEYPGICHALARRPDTTFAARVDIMHDSIVVATASGWWRGTGRSVHPFEGMLDVEIVQDGYRDLPLNDGQWSLRLRSDPELALRDFESTRYWAGDVTVPLRVTDSSNWEALKANGEDRAR
jgi:hypothetical protein